MSFYFKEKEFKLCRTLLFDGESGLRSKKTQQEIFKKFQIKVYADPFYKRYFAERAVREIKLRMGLYCSLKGTTNFF